MLPTTSTKCRATCSLFSAGLWLNSSHHILHRLLVSPGRFTTSTWKTLTHTLHGLWIQAYSCTLKNIVYENTIIDRFDTRYCEHLSVFKTCLDRSKANMIIPSPPSTHSIHNFHISLLSELISISSSLYLTFFFPVIQFLFNRFFKNRFLWNILLTINAFHF